MKLLILMVGLPRAGKSTYAQKLHNYYGHPVINPDTFRLQMYGHRFYKEGERHVWATVHSAVSAILATTGTVILDATNVTAALRRTFAETNPDATIVNITVHEEPEVCIDRARQDGMEDLVDVIKRMDDMYESPHISDEAVIEVSSDRVTYHNIPDAAMIEVDMENMALPYITRAAAARMAKIEELWANAERGSNETGEGFYGFLADKGYIEHIERIVKDDG
jgi:predicted kinase